MKIGIVTTSFPRWEGDIAGQFVLGLSRYLTARSHDVEVLAPEPAESIDRPRFDRIVPTWIPYLRPRYLQRTFYRAGAPDNLRRDPFAWTGALTFPLCLDRELRRRCWDAVISHWAIPSAIAVGRRAMRDHIAVLHSADVSLLERLPNRRRWVRAVTDGADALVFVHAGLRERFLACCDPSTRSAARTKAHVIPMGVEKASSLATRDTLRQEFKLDRFTVLFLGRLVSIKRVDRLIRAAAECEGMELLIAGDGPERKRLERIARGHRVRFLGIVHGEGKARLLHAADAMALTSGIENGRSEGLPTAALEAIAAGLPVIATPETNLSQILASGPCGMMVPATELAAAFRTLAASPVLRNELAASARREGNRYVWSAIGPQFESLFSTG